MTNSFGARLRWWRKRRGLSQLDLAGAAGVSQRHVSFLESGRTQPSREMVLCLAAALDVPQPPVLAMHFRQGAISLRLFTTIATLGTPHDVTVQELRIECFFPADVATSQVFHHWATNAAR